MKTSPILRKIFSISILSIGFSTVVSAQGPGTWNGQPLPASTPCPTPSSTNSIDNAIGIGTTEPRGWHEIKYVNDQHNGLIISKEQGGLPVANTGGTFIPTFDGVIDAFPFDEEGGGGGTTTTVFNIPINFQLTPYNTFSARPMIWARTENMSMFSTSGSGQYTSRFIVTPYGRSGLNIENPRATLDIKSLGAHNIPAVIIGRQVIGTTDKTQHLHFVPLLNDNGYNQISVRNDQGMFFTDGMGTDGANMNGAFVIAPWANDRDPAVGGIRIDNMGNVQIHGETKTTKLNVNTTWWSDFVFDKTYKLRTLAEVETFIAANKHLPDVPSEKEVLENGIDVGNMQAIHMQKIEELTLYTIAQEKQITEQKMQLENQQNEMEKQKLKLQDLEKKLELLLNK